MASVRLTLGELARTDPRPLREIIADAVHLADLAQRDYLGAVQHGEQDAETIGRMLESARYAASLAKIALDSGLPLDAESGSELVPIDTALSATVAALVETVGDVVDAVLDPRLRSPIEAVWAGELVSWAQLALRARLCGGEVPPLPVRPLLPVAEIVGSGRSSQSSAFADRGPSVVDAELVDDDPDTDEPGDAELIREWERLTGRTYDPAVAL